MRLPRLTWTVLLVFGVVGLLAGPARAEFFFEGQIWGEEFDDGPGEVPALELFQTISDKRFKTYEEVVQLFQLELGTTPAIQDGLIRIRSKVFKADGSSIKLPMMTASVEDNAARVQRLTEVALAPGDVIRWRVRFKGVPTVAQDGACQVIVGVASDELLE